MRGSRATSLVLVALLSACAPSLSPSPATNGTPTAAASTSGPTAAASLPGPTGSPAAPTPSGASNAPSASFEGLGIRLTYPATWREFHYDVLSSFSSLIAYVGTVEVPDPCTRTASSRTCTRGFTLPPGGTEVVVESHGFPGYDILDQPMDEGRGVLTQVGGLPARRALTGPDPDTGADAVVTWYLSVPGSVDNWYMITGYVRGPGLPELIAQVDALIADFQYDPPVVPLPSDPAVMRAAVAAYIAEVKYGAVGWQCVPLGSGTAHATIDTLLDGPPLSKPVGATCSVTVLPTARQLWKVTVAVVPDKPIPEGVGGAVVWVAPPSPAPGASAQP